MNRSLNNERGLSMIVVVGLICCVLLILMVLLSLRKSPAQVLFKINTAAQLAARNIRSTVENDVALRDTIQRSAALFPAENMGCFVNPISTPCCSGGPPCVPYEGTVDLVGAGGAPPPAAAWYPRSSNSGFDMFGNPCSTFSSSGNDACPFRYDLRWKAICENLALGACNYPAIEISVTLDFKPGNLYAPYSFRKDKYDFSYVRPSPF